MPESAQFASESDEKKSRGLGSYVLWAFVAVMVYVLSSGPWMRGYWYSGRSSKLEPLGIIYWPLDWLWGTTLLHKPLGIYWHLWCPKFFDRNSDVGDF